MDSYTPMMTQITDQSLRKCFEQVYEIVEDCLDGYRDDMGEAIEEIKRLLEDYADDILG